MAKLSLTKASLTKQKKQLKIFEEVLPSLELKRRQLSLEQSKAQEVLAQTQNQLAALELAIVEKLPMLSNQLVELTDIVKVTGVELGEEVVVIAQEEPPRCYPSRPPYSRRLSLARRAETPVRADGNRAR